MPLGLFKSNIRITDFVMRYCNQGQGNADGICILYECQTITCELQDYLLCSGTERSKGWRLNVPTMFKWEGLDGKKGWQIRGC